MLQVVIVVCSSCNFENNNPNIFGMYETWDKNNLFSDNNNNALPCGQATKFLMNSYKVIAIIITYAFPGYSVK